VIGSLNKGRSLRFYTPTIDPYWKNIGEASANDINQQTSVAKITGRGMRDCDVI